MPSDNPKNPYSVKLQPSGWEGWQKGVVLCGRQLSRLKRQYPDVQHWRMGYTIVTNCDTGGGNG